MTWDEDSMTGDFERPREDGDNTEEPEVYTTKTEREVAFKMIAAHALVDASFYELLRKSPREAAAHLHFLLDESDYRYLENMPLEGEPPGIQWDAIDAHAEEVRKALNADSVVRSLW